MDDGKTTYRARVSRESPCGTVTGDVVIDGPIRRPCAIPAPRRPTPSADTPAATDAPPTRDPGTTSPDEHSRRPDDDSLDA